MTRPVRTTRRAWMHGACMVWLAACSGWNLATATCAADIVFYGLLLLLGTYVLALYFTAAQEAGERPPGKNLPPRSSSSAAPSPPCPGGNNS